MHRRELSFICTTHREWDDQKMDGSKNKERRAELGPPKNPSPSIIISSSTPWIYPFTRTNMKLKNDQDIARIINATDQIFNILQCCCCYQHIHIDIILVFQLPSTQTWENARRESYARQHDEFQEIPTVASRTTQHTTSHHRPNFFGFVVRIQERPTEDFSGTQLFFFFLLL